MARQLYLLHHQVFERPIGGNSVIVLPTYKVYVTRTGAMPAQTKTVNAASPTLTLRSIGDLKVGDLVQVGSDDSKSAQVSVLNKATKTLTLTAFSPGGSGLDFVADDASTRVVLKKESSSNRIPIYSDDSGATLKSEYVANGYLTTDTEGQVWGFLSRPNYDLHVEAADGSVTVFADRGRSEPQTFINVAEYGVLGDASTVQTTLMQEAIDDAVARGVELLIPGGFAILVDGPLTASGSLKIRGAGEGLSSIIGLPGTYDLLTLSGQSSTLDGVGFVGSSVVGALVKVNAANNRLANVQTTLGRNGILASANATALKCDNCKVQLAVESGFVLQSNVATVRLLHCIASNNGQHGFYISQANEIALVQCRASDNSTGVTQTSDGFFLTGNMAGIRLNDCRAYGNTQRYGLNIGSGVGGGIVLGGDYRNNGVNSINDALSGTHYVGVLA